MSTQEQNTPATLDDILKELRELNEKIQFMMLASQYTGPSIVQCEHDYPTVWHGTVPPCCRKCGKPDYSLFPTYSSTTT